MPQGRISNKFTVLEEPKEEQSLTFFLIFIPSFLFITMRACYLEDMTKNRKSKNVLNNKTLNKS